MKNPLLKRVPRELRQDFGKYLVIFLFLTLEIAVISGFLVSDNSYSYRYNASFTENHVEDGHLAFNSIPSEETLQALSERADVTLEELFYFEETLAGTEKTIRVYSTERTANIPYLIEGEFPSSATEIALDRLFAKNNDLAIGDTLVLRDQELTVSGMIALPDYSCLFENNSDMMFDAINFSVALMTPEGFSLMDSSHLVYNYAWFYPEFIEREDEASAKAKSDALIDVLKEVIVENNQSYLKNLLTGSGSGASVLTIEDYLPRYLNQAINFAGDDMSGDKASMIVFDYIITLVLAFVFAVTISGTISAEAGVIGTLRASGYSRRELIFHYMIPPIVVSLLGALIGNLLGYTVIDKLFVTVYEGSFTLAPYRPLWNPEAFLLTTAIPLVLMFVINFGTLWYKLRLSPLRFLRHDLNTRKRKKALRLNTKIPFVHRFRIRILLQNIPNYLTMFFGIFIGGVLLVFGSMFVPLLDDYKELVVSERLSDYQYIMMSPQETKSEQAEKFSLTSLKTTNENYKIDEVSVYGILPASRYVAIDSAEGTVAVSNAFSEKFGLSVGDTFTLRDPYDEKILYDFEVSEIYTYSAALTVFLPKADYAKLFAEGDTEYTGYFSNEALTDLDSNHVAAVITVEDLAKISNQLTDSMGSMMSIINYAGIIFFCLLMYLLSKQILEKNSNSISMTKILGFSDLEIGKLYIVATSVVVVLSLLISVPLIDGILRAIFSSYLYTEMTGYIPYIISPTCFVKMVVIGLLCYIFISLLQLRKIQRIPKSEALKNME